MARSVQTIADEATALMSQPLTEETKARLRELTAELHEAVAASLKAFDEKMEKATEAYRQARWID